MSARSTDPATPDRLFHFPVAPPTWSTWFWTTKRVALTVVAALSMCAFWLGISAVIGGKGIEVVLLVCLSACAAIVAARHLPAKLEVGADGLRVRWLGTRHFVPFAEIASIERYSWTRPRLRIGYRILLVDGRMIDLPIESVIGTGIFPKLDYVVYWAFANFKRGQTPESALLARGARTTVDWVKDLRQLTALGREDFRGAPVDPEALWHVLENAAEPSEMRAAAAVALHPQLDEEGRTRIRIAAAESADAPLRTALAQIAEAAQEQEATEALDHVSARLHHQHSKEAR